MKSLTKKPFFIVIISIFLFTACSMERNIADGYLTGKNKDTLFVSIDPAIIYTCYKLDSNASFKVNKNEVVENDIINCKSLNYFTDSLILKQLFFNFLGELYNYPVIVKYVNNVFPDIKYNNQYYFNVVQIQIEEYETVFIDSAFSDTAVHYFQTPITAINFNTWFEVYQIANDNTLAKKVYFSQLIYKEKVDGKFKKNKIAQTYDYKYRINPITKGVVYWFVRYSAVKNAQYVFDFLLNNYIRKNSPNTKNRNYSFHYSRNIDKLINYQKQRLIEVTN